MSASAPMPPVGAAAAPTGAAAAPTGAAVTVPPELLELLRRLGAGSLEDGVTIILPLLHAEAPALAADRRYKCFDDCAAADDVAIQSMLRIFPKNELVTALVGLPETQRQRFYANMSDRAALILRGDMKHAGLFRRSEIDRAQRALVRLANLQAADALGPDFFGRGDDDEALVPGPNGAEPWRATQASDGATSGPLDPEMLALYGEMANPKPSKLRPLWMRVLGLGKAAA